MNQVAVDALDAGRSIPRKGDGGFRWTHGHVSDVTLGILLAAEALQAGYRIYNVGDPVTPTMTEWVELFAKHMGLDVQWEDVEEIPDDFGQLGPMPTDVVVDSSRIRAELGYAEITTAAERVADIVAQARAARPEG